MIVELVAQETKPHQTTFIDWIAPGSAVGAVLAVVIVFLKQMRYMQTRYDSSLKMVTDRIDSVATDFRNQVDRIVTHAQQNEERRMNQVENLFEKVMVISTQTVQAITELKHGFSALSKKVEKRQLPPPREEG